MAPALAAAARSMALAWTRRAYPRSTRVPNGVCNWCVRRCAHGCCACARSASEVDIYSRQLLRWFPVHHTPCPVTPRTLLLLRSRLVRDRQLGRERLPAVMTAPLVGLLLRQRRANGRTPTMDVSCTLRATFATVLHHHERWAVCSVAPISISSLFATRPALSLIHI